MFGKVAKGDVMYLKIFNFDFFDELLNTLYAFLKSVWELFCLLIYFAIVLGIVVFLF